MKYLAYGANMDVEIMKQRCKGAKFLGTGILDDYRLMFKGIEPSAYATIEQWDGFKVPYVLWEISTADEKHLDRYEGYPKFYQKHTVTIEFNGEKFLAMYYAKPEDIPVGQPMTHYIAVLDEAYRRFKFDYSILQEALRLSDEDFSRRNSINF